MGLADGPARPDAGVVAGAGAARSGVGAPELGGPQAVHGVRPPLNRCPNRDDGKGGARRGTLDSVSAGGTIAREAILTSRSARWPPRTMKPSTTFASCLPTPSGPATPPTRMTV